MVAAVLPALAPPYQPEACCARADGLKTPASKAAAASAIRLGWVACVEDLAGVAMVKVVMWCPQGYNGGGCSRVVAAFAAAPGAVNAGPKPPRYQALRLRVLAR